MPELIVTNFNRNFTGVSATAGNVIRQHMHDYDLALVGHPLPGCPTPITKTNAVRLSRQRPKERPFTIWHVRRNTEMRAALWARDVLRLPIRIVFTSAAIRRHSAFPRWLISRMDAVVATTVEAASFVPNVQAIVPHGVDTYAFYPAQDRTNAWALTGFPGKRGIATIGRIRQEKGTDRFVDAMIALLPQNQDVTALVLGRAARSDQAFLERLQNKVEDAGLSGRILFPGEVPPQDLPALIRALSMVVQLPRYEGYGMTPLEGMASAVPFVATDQGYYRSFSAQNTCGVIVPEDDLLETVRCIHDLLNDPNRLETMGFAAQEAAVLQLSSAREAEEISKLYEALWAKG